MAKSYTFILVPDAKSQCKRYTVPVSVFSVIGMIGIVVLVVGGIVAYVVWGKYDAMSRKAEQVATLQKTSLSQRQMIERFEGDITQLTNNLSYINHLNFRLMVLAGLNPEGGEQNLGLGGSEEENSAAESQKQKK
jgi:hypothetical protein